MRKPKSKCQTGGLQPIPLDTLYDPQTADSTLRLLDPLTALQERPSEFESMDALKKAEEDLMRMKRAIVSDLDKGPKPAKFRYREKRYGGYQRFYQDGGFTEDPEPPETPVEQVVFDSTDDYQPQAQAQEEFDELPMDDDGFDLAAFTPTLGNVSVKRAPLDRRISLLIDQLGITPSSTNTGKHNPGSRHYAGRAFDAGLNTSFGGSMKKMKEFKERFLELQKNNDLYAQFELVDETQRPNGQEVWTGAHYHIQLK